MMEAGSVLGSWIPLARRRWVTGAVVFSVVLATGTALLFLSRPVYRSEAALRLGEPPPPSGVSPTSGVLSFFQLGGDAFANDLELLGSRSLAEEVVERVGLNARLIAPRGWHRDSMLAALRTTRATREATYRARLGEGGVRVTMTSPRDSVIGAFDPGAPVPLPGATVAFLPWREGMPREVRIATLPFAEAVRRTRSGIRFERPRREANVVVLGYQDDDPDLADAVVEATVASFTSLRARLHHRESNETVDSLRSVAEGTAVELRAAEERLVTLQRESRLVAPEAQSEALVERHADVLSGLQRARAELAAVDEMARRLDAAGGAPRSWTALLGYPAFFENETLGRLLTELTARHAQREELGSRQTADTREVRVLDSQIAYMEASLRDVAREYRAGLDERIASLEPQLRELDAALAALPGGAAELGRRQRDVRLLSEILVLTEQRLRQEELREALTHSNVQIVDPPALLARPVWPRKKLGLAVTLLLAAGCATLGMVVRERTDPRVRRVDQLRTVLGRPVLAVVQSGPTGPRFSAAQADALLRGGDSGGRRAVTLVVANGGGPTIAFAAAPDAASRQPAGAAGGPSPGTTNGGAMATAETGPAAGPAERAAGVSADVDLRAAGPLRDFADAVEVAAGGAPVVLVVESGRTTVEEVRTSARMITDAGGVVSGAVLVLRPGEDAGVAWS